MAESALKTTLGTQLRAWRHRQGLTQEQLAERLQVTPRYIAGVERGERNLSLDSVDTLAKQLGTVPPPAARQCGRGLLIRQRLSVLPLSDALRRTGGDPVGEEEAW